VALTAELIALCTGARQTCMLGIPLSLWRGHIGCAGRNRLDLVSNAENL
jgi:hypothetical protein